MSTYREIVYMVNDVLKFVSDDSHCTEEHILFLVDKFRTFLLKQRYSDIRKEIPESNCQTICIDLEEVYGYPSLASAPCTSERYLRSTKPIPHIMSVGSRKITTMDYFQGNINYVDSERFQYAGYNKYLQSQAYGTIAPDSHLYMKSGNPQFYYLKKAKVTGIFENSTQITEFQCPNSNGTVTCDIMDMTFPMEESLVPPLIELVVKELAAFKYQASDTENNAKDDLSDLATYIRQQLAEGKRSDLYKNP
jgi:hypothetical protein